MKHLISPFIMMLVFTACNSNSDKAKEATPEKSIIDTVQKTETAPPVKEQLYACEMHPEVIGKKGEKCSKCGMNLTVPVKQ
jgi:hypothetical protein